LPIIQHFRKAARIPALAILLITGIIIFTAACSGQPSAGGSDSPTLGTPSSAAKGTGTTADFGPGLGIYDGKFNSSGIEKAATWLGSASSIKYAQDFIDASSWSNISTPWQLPNWKGTPYTMVWGVPMLPCGSPSTQCATNVSDFNEVAAGGADGYYKTLAQNLVAGGFGSSYIRIGWEFNATFMGWSICNQEGSGLTSWAGDFVPAYRNIVTSMRSVSGADFKFIWNPIVSSNASCGDAKIENYYPGDSYVDMVALDVYDGIGQTTTDTARWTDLLNGVNGGNWTSVAPDTINGQKFEGYGLTWLTAFGKEHHKEIGLPEWGLDAPGAEVFGGGDDPYFMTQMANWIKANATGPAVFWNYTGGTLPLDIPNYTSGGTPQATAVFKAAFSTGS
jgi:Glycosyl hydrolase family 26